MKTKALIVHDATCLDWDRFEESLYDHFGVNAVTMDVNCIRKTSGDMRWANDLCALIKTTANGAEKICDRVLKRLVHAVKVKKSYAIDECGAGMNKIVFPVIQNDEISGFVNICGRPFSNTNQIYTRYIQETVGADTQEIKKRLSSVNPIDPRTLKEMKRFVTGYTHPILTDRLCGHFRRPTQPDQPLL